MSESNIVHVYPHALKTIMMANVDLCRHRHFLMIVPPKRAIALENLYTHLRITFNTATVPAAERVITSIGIANEVPTLYTSDPSRYRKFDINQSADGNGVIELRIDMTSLVEPSHIGYREYFGDSTLTETYVMFSLSESLQESFPDNIGTINLWKLDGQYTTLGTR